MVSVTSSRDVATGVAVVEIAFAPVNALGKEVRKGLLEEVRKCGADPAVSALVLIGRGGTFPAGADINEFSDAAAMDAEPKLNDIMPYVEGCRKPVVAAIDGTALGGGLELALACHWRVATARAVVGLPEVHIGLLPGAGGTQRLPRLVGVHAALKLIVGGAPTPAAEALELGILDEIVDVPSAGGGKGKDKGGDDGPLRAAAVAFAAARAAEIQQQQQQQQQQQHLNRTSGGDDALASRRLSLRAVPLPTTLTRVGHAASLAACDRLKALQPPAKQGGLAKRHCCDAVAASVRLGTHLEALEMGKMNNSTNAMANSISEKKRLELEALSFELGLAEEARLFDQLVASQQSAAKRHLFFAERAAGRLPRTSTRTSTSSGGEKEEEAGGGGGGGGNCRVAPGMVMGIVGAGTMGSGIAIAALAAKTGFVGRVVVVDRSTESLERAKAYIARGVGSLQRRGRLSKKVAAPEAIAQRLSLTTEMGHLAQCNVVVEAVFEKLELKKTVFAELARVCDVSAILATNTSTLNVDLIAAAAPAFDAKGSVLGMHFFSPAHLMKLVEVVRGQHTGRCALQGVLALTKAMGKVGVVVGNCDGFVGNRVLDPYSYEAVFCIEEGASPLLVDAALNSGKGVAALKMAAANAARAAGNPPLPSGKGAEPIDALWGEGGARFESGAFGGFGGGGGGGGSGSGGFGMAMGPLEMADLAGGDIGYNVRRERGLLDPKERARKTHAPSFAAAASGALPIRYCELGDKLVEAGRVGHKTGKGWYNYTPPAAAAGSIGKGEGKSHARPPPLGIDGGVDEEVKELIRAHRAAKGVVSDYPHDDGSGASESVVWPPTVTATEVQERLLFGLVNEAFKVLEEGICEKPSDLDVIYVFGYGFPDWRGGPFFWADNEVGLGALLAGVRKYEKRFPNVPHWLPSRLLASLAEAGAPLAHWRQHLDRINSSYSSATRARL